MVTDKKANSIYKNYKANVWIICLAGTQDEVWLEEALKSFDKEKIEFINFKDLQL